MKRSDWLLVGTIAAAALSFSIVFFGWLNCDGIYVRTVVGYVCIDSK